MMGVISAGLLKKRLDIVPMGWENMPMSDIRASSHLDRTVARNNESLFQLMVDSAPSALVLVDDHGKIVFLNPQAEKTFGYKRDELIGKKIEILMPHAVRNQHTHYRTGYQEKPGTRAMGAGRDLYGLRKDGTEIPVEIGLTPIEASEGRFILASIVDITERKRLEKEVLEATENERRRIGRDLHDSLGQKLLGMGFLTKALQDDLASKSLAQAGEASRIVQLINDALIQSRRLAKGLYALELESNDLSTALKQLASDIKAMTGISCEFVSGAPFIVEDKTVAMHLFRIVQEALNNAVKHSQATKIEVAVEKNRAITVKDNGIGIPVTSYQAQGMGLKVMRYRANMIGASIDIRRDKDGGTVVRCMPPVRKETVLSTSDEPTKS